MYYFIKIELEELLAQMVSAWRTTSPTAFTIITPIYSQKGKEKTGQSMVVNYPKNLPRQYFDYQISTPNFENITKYLAGFILEADMQQDEYAPFVKAIRDNECPTFENAGELLEFLNQQ